MTDLYLYQTVHVARGRALHVAEHAAVLDAASREWFGRPYTPSPGALRTRIELLAEKEHYPTAVSGFVRIELRPDGEERLLPAGISLYDGYAYRSVQPAAVTVHYENPFTSAPTSVREAAAAWARRVAERAGAEVAIRCDAAGIFHEAEDAPLFAIVGRTVLAAPGPESVERAITRRAVQAAGLEYREEPFGIGELRGEPSAGTDRDGLFGGLFDGAADHEGLFAGVENRRIDELFFTDHRGITSLSHCNGLPLMTFLAERIAGALE